MRYRLICTFLLAFFQLSCTAASFSAAEASSAGAEASSAAAASSKVKGYVIGFYNVENLFDTVDDPHTNDNDFLPEGKNGWTADRYEKKLHNIARVISAMKDETGKYHTILGLSEVENRKVLEDLVKDSQISKAGYKIVHYDSPDRRGIDVALLYRPSEFKLLDSESIPVDLNKTSVKLTLDENAKAYFRTRDILMAHGLIKDEHVAIYVAHLPSRQGGKNGDLRSVGAEIIYNHARKMEKKYPGIKIIVMGDMNDNPEDQSQIKWLHGKASISEMVSSDFFDPFISMHKAGLGSEEYKGEWNIFDIIHVNYNLATAPGGGLKIQPQASGSTAPVSRGGSRQATGSGKFYGHIFNPDFLTQQSGKYAGTPFRTFSGDEFINGFSDHYPTYIVIR